MKPFFVAYAGILTNEHNEILLLQRAEHSKTNALHWEPPGGKPEGTENLSAALIREVQEETGLLVEISHPLGTGMLELEDKKVAYLIMACTITRGSFRLSAEHRDSIWTLPDEALKFDLAPHFVPFLRKYAGYC